MVEQKMVSTVSETLDELLRERRELIQRCAELSHLAASSTEFVDQQAQVMERQRHMIENLLSFVRGAKGFLQDIADRATDDVVCFQKIDIEHIDYLLSFKCSARGSK